MLNQTQVHPSLKELVIKLNDRNIQRQRENGFTIYTILAVIVYIIFALVELTPKFIDTNVLLDDLIVLTIVGDSTFCLIYFIVFVLGKKCSGFTKVFPKEDFFTLDASFAPYLISVTLLSACNFYSYYYSTSHSLIYILFGALLFSNGFAPPLVKLWQIWSYRKTKFRIPEFTMFNTIQTNYIRAVAVICGVLLAIAILFLVFKEEISINDSEIASAVRYSIYLVGLSVAISITFDLVLKKNFNDDLEELEMEIYLNNLTNDDIRKKLEEEYFGQDFKIWAEYRMKGISEYFNNLNEQLRNLNQELLNLSTEFTLNKVPSINQNIQIRESLINNFRQFDKDFKKQSNYLKTFSSIENEEWTTFVQLQNRYNYELKVFGEIDATWLEQYNRIKNFIHNEL